MASFSERQGLTDDEWNQIDHPIGEFEAAWGRGERPAIADYLSPEGPYRHLLLIELVHADLEFRLKAGEPVRVEEYLAAFPDLTSKPAVVLSLIQAEWTIRARHEPSLSVDDYLSRFPGMALELGSNPVTPRSAQPITPPMTLTPDAAFAARYAEAPLPRMLGKYELRQQAGSGGFGFVYRAWDPALRRIVAIKIPRPEIAVSSANVYHFLREARNVIDLQHPNIVKIWDAGPIEGTVCLISEFVEGMTLAERLEGGPLGVAESVKLMILILGALGHAHSRRIIHRDLKPSNILLDRDGQPHLTDFGLAKRTSSESTLSPAGAARVWIGTPAYMAPEQARGDTANVDARSDVYGAGVLLYELLTGKVPFRGRGQLLEVQIEEAEPVPLRDLNGAIPANLEAICLRALAKRPADRYQSAQAMAEDLARYDLGEPIAAPSGDLPSSSALRRSEQLRRAPLGIALFFVVALVGLTIGLQWLGMERRQACDSRLIDQLIQSFLDSTSLPFQGGTDAADEHRRMTDAIWKRSETWLEPLTSAPISSEMTADLLVRLADHSAAVGTDPEAQAAWERAVAALEPQTRNRPDAWEREADLTRGLKALADLAASGGRPDDAQKLAERAASTWTELVRKQRDRLAASPTRVPARLNLAEAILSGDRATRYAADGVALGTLDEAEQIINRLRLQGNLGSQDSQRLIGLQVGLASHYLSAGDPGRAAFWGRLTVRFAEIDRAGLSISEVAASLARAKIVIGLATSSELLENAGSVVDSEDQAASMFRSAYEDLVEASARDPLDLHLKRDAESAAAGLGSLLARRGQLGEAVRSFHQALCMNRAVRSARPRGHADRAASASLNADLARVELARGRSWAAITRLGIAVWRADQAVRLAPGRTIYADYRSRYARAFLRILLFGEQPPPLSMPLRTWER